MDHFELAKLNSDRDRLGKILRAFSEMQVKTGFMVARDDLLKMHGSNDGRKFTGSATVNYLTTVIEYLGEEDRCYFKPEEFAKALSSTPAEKKAFAVPSHAQPLGWTDELMDKSIKPNEGVEFDPQHLKNVLSYLLRPDLSKTAQGDYFGVIFRNDEMITTTGQLMLIQNGLPVVTSEPRLLGFDAAVSLYSILRTPYVSEVQMGVTKRTGMFGIRVELDEGTEMFFWSKPRYQPIDSYKDPRPMVDPRSVGFVVHGPFLQSILEGTLQAVAQNEKPVVSLRTTNTGLEYTSYGADENHVQAPRPIYRGEIPMTRSLQNPEEITICARADNLIQAVKGLGDSCQFIVPYHPLLGFQIHPIEPFYVNCNQNQFALVAPFVLDRDQVIPLEKLKRKANNAMEP